MTLTTPNTAAQAPVAPPRRKVGARLSGGHLLMIVSGLAAFVLVFALLGRGQATVEVAVAASTIDADAQVASSMVKPIKIPADSPLASSLVRFDQVGKDTRYAATRIEKDTPIATSMLSQKRESGKAQRETAIQVDKAFVAGGRIAKGDRIDVLTVSSDGQACRTVAGLRVTAVESTSGGALTASSGGASVWVAIEKDGDEVRIASTMGKKLQVVLSTGLPAAKDGVCSGDLRTAASGR